MSPAESPARISRFVRDAVVISESLGVSWVTETVWWAVLLTFTAAGVLGVFLVLFQIGGVIL